MPYVVISGNSGVGKSRLLASLSGRLASAPTSEIVVIDEKQLHHPRLLRMFEEPERWALPIQLNFVVERVASLLAAFEGTPDGAEPLVVAERCLDEDRLFFEHHVDRGSIARSALPPYDALVSELRRKLPSPDVVVYLTAPVAVLHARLEASRRDGDRDVELDTDPLAGYLQDVETRYRQWVQLAAASSAHFLTFDTSLPEYSTDQVVEALVTTDTQGCVTR